MSRPVERARDVVELRVHGVSGTPPEDLLDRQLVRQVAGDKIAGFYRPRLREEWRDRPSNDPASDDEPYSTVAEVNAPPTLEGYSWGGLTSGSPSRALWLVLLPFSLANLAPRLRPVPGTGPESWRAAALAVWFLSRVMAVGLTVTLTLGAAGVGEAILAWQCDTGCSNLSWPLSVMFHGQPILTRMAWGAALPLLVLAALGLLSWRKSVQYDLVRPAGMDAADADRVPERGTTAEPRLGHPAFWYGRYPISRLRHLHLQAGVTAVGFTVVLAAPPSGVRTAGMAVAALVLLLVFAAFGWPRLLERDDPPGVPDDPPLSVRLRQTGWILGVWIPAPAVLVLGFVGVAGRPDGTSGDMPGYDGLITAWFTGQSGLTAVMLVLVAVMAIAERDRIPRRSMWSMGTGVLTVLALYLGAALTSGFVLLSAAWIDSSGFWVGLGDIEDLLGPDSGLEVPQSLRMAGLATFLVAVIVTVVLVLTAIWAITMWIRGGAGVDQDHARQDAERAEREAPSGFRELAPARVATRRKEIARSIWLARRVDFLPGYLAVLVLGIGVPGTALTLAYGIGGGLRTVELWRPGWFPDVEYAALGVWLIGVLTVSLIVVGAFAFRVSRTRKAVGIIWDLAAFWPRDVHPLAPPCYAERAVPELGLRLRAHAEAAGTDPAAVGAGDSATAPNGTSASARPGRQSRSPSLCGLVVLAGHSQGTVISMAVLLGPGRPAADRTAFLTFGTVLRRLYGRFFPLYFSRDAFACLSSSLGGGPASGSAAQAWPVPGDPAGADRAGLVPASTRWRNLWRRTDYLGGRLGDPLAEWPRPGAGGPERAGSADNAGAAGTRPGAESRAGAGRAVSWAGAGPESPGDTVPIDHLLVDPQFLAVPGDRSLPAPGRHSNFPRDPEFQVQLRLLVEASLADTHRCDDGRRFPFPWAPALSEDHVADLVNPRHTM